MIDVDESSLVNDDSDSRLGGRAHPAHVEKDLGISESLQELDPLPSSARRRFIVDIKRSPMASLREIAPILVLRVS